MNNYDLCIIWDWMYDSDFLKLLNHLCSSRHLSVYEITPDNLEGSLDALNNQQLGYRVFLDRASEGDNRFMPLVEWACRHSKYYINRHEKASRSWDKSIMHYELIKAGIYTPYSIVLPSFNEQPVISDIDISQLGERFVIKPIHGSGGEGVVMDLTSLNQVLELRRTNPDYRYLLQKFIIPQKLNDHQAWFRILYCREQVYPCWWDLETHIYTPITETEKNQFNLGKLLEITRTIARISDLDLFSTEIAYTEENLFVAVDYVNDQPDFRLQSKAMDGVPDDIVNNIAESIAELVAEHCSPLSGENQPPG